MEERQVTVDDRTYKMPEPFLILATQNPIEYEGTFPLPEAQLDRFLMRISLGHPEPAEEIRILDAQQFIHPLETIEQVVAAEELSYPGIIHSATRTDYQRRAVLAHRLIVNLGAIRTWTRATSCRISSPRCRSPGVRR